MHSLCSPLCLVKTMRRLRSTAAKLAGGAVKVEVGVLGRRSKLPKNMYPNSSSPTSHTQLGAMQHRSSQGMSHSAARTQSSTPVLYSEALI